MSPNGYTVGRKVSGWAAARGLHPPREGAQQGVSLLHLLFEIVPGWAVRVGRKLFPRRNWPRRRERHSHPATGGTSYGGMSHPPREGVQQGVSLLHLWFAIISGWAGLVRRKVSGWAAYRFWMGCISFLDGLHIGNRFWMGCISFLKSFWSAIVSGWAAYLLT